MYPNYINKPSFMTNTTNTSFGASSSSFGQPAANTPMFSSMQPSNIFQTPSTSSFNAGPTSQPSFGSNLFGQQQQPSTSGLFGSTNTFAPNKTTFGFGSTPGQAGLFGQQPQQQTGSSLFQSNTTNLFGSTNAFGNQATTHTGTVIKFAPVTGTDTMQKNGVTQSISTKHHCITCMKEYENKSLEELRFEDYSCNRKGPQQQAGFPTGSLFGQTENKQSFEPRFGQSTTFGQNTPGFGVTNQTNSTPSLFGKPTTFGTTTSNTSSFGFNATPATSNPFSANQAAKPFSQPLFGTPTTQTQPTFGNTVFGQTANQNTTSNLFQKSAQPTTGFNTGQPGFSFNQTGTTQTPSLFQVSKPNTGFGIFGQTNTGTTGFAQTNQPTFGTNFGKTTTFAQPSFGINLGGGLQPPQQQPFGNTGTTKPTSLFGGTTTGGSSFFGNNVFQQTPNNFSLNMNQQQQMQFPPEPSDDSKNISLLATDSFPDGPHVYGLEPVLGESINSTTNPQDIKAMLDYSKKRDEMLGTRAKIKVHLPKPKRGSNFSKEFFDTNQALKSSHKRLVIRKFNENNSSTIYNKYKNELLEEAEECLKTENGTVSEADSSSIISPRSFISDSDVYLDKPPENEINGRKASMRLFDTFSDDAADDTKSNKTSFAFEESTAFLPLIASSKAGLGETKIVKSSIPLTNGIVNGVSLSDEETAVTEGEDSPLNVSTSETESSENPAGVILTKPEYYMYPALKDLQQYVEDNGECIVQGLTIGRRGYGNVYFPDPIDISNMNIDEIVHFRHREVIIYPDDTKKPPVGEGLNRRAQVTLDKIYPREKGTNKYITDTSQITQSNFVDNLMHVTQKHNCKFVDYRPKTGSWVFKVKHFSKYAFTDSDEEECEVLGDKGTLKKSDVFKKIEEIEEIPKLGLGGSTTESRVSLLSETESLIGDPTLMDYWPEEEQYMLTEEIYRTNSSIQTLKFSLFTNLETVPTTKKVEAQVKAQPEIRCEVICTPKVHKLPDMSMAIFPEKIAGTQRVYTELGIFKNSTYKVGWGKGFSFYNSELIAERDLVYALTHCSIQAESKGHYNLMMPNLSEMLQITLEESKFSFDEHNIPTLHINEDLSYLQRQTDLFNDHVRTQALTGKDKYLSSVWNLCTALWGPGDKTSCARRQYLSDWLKKFSYDLSDEWNMAEDINKNRSDAFKTIFKLLSFHKITEACEFAAKNNLPQISLLIGQLSANERFKYWMRKYTESFAWKEKNVMPEEFKRLYLLLSGIPVDASINVCDGLDWMRCFGFHLWYVSPAAAPIQTAYALYKQAFEETDSAISPMPPYCEAGIETKNYDLLYQILSVYSDCTYQLCNVLHPETHTENIIDYRLSWFLLQLFLSLKAGLIGESEQEHLHTTFSTQLEDMGLWKWSIFTLLFLKNNLIKKNLIMKILDRNLSVFQETTPIEHELVNTFKIPPSWIHETKAIKAKVSGYYYQYFQQYVYMEDWQQANTALVDYILPELFVNEQYEYLLNFINKVEPFSKTLVNWNTQGGLFKDFIELRDMLYENNEEEIRSLVKLIAGKLGSLFRRINCFPANNDKQKLCVAELSRKCALLFKLIYKALDSHTFQTKFVDLLNNLIIPPDIKHHEIFYLISKYVQPGLLAQ